MKNKNRHVVVRYTLKAKKGAPTHIKGWMNDERNIQWDEALVMTEGLKQKDLLEGNVILDIDDNKIVKNWKSNDEGVKKTYEELLEYYLKNYAEYMGHFIQASNKNRA